MTSALTKIARLVAVTALLAVAAIGQVNSYQVGGVYDPSTFGTWRLYAANAVAGGSTSGTITWIKNQTGVLDPNQTCSIVTKGSPEGGKTFFPFAVGTTVFVQDANSETVTVTAVNNIPGGCSFSAVFVNAHNPGAFMGSASKGLLEAIASTSSAGGLYRLGADWSGTLSMITGSAIGGTNQLIEFITGGTIQYYQGNGSGFIQTNTIGSSGAFYGYKNTSLTAIAAPTAGTFGVSANASGIAAATYRVTQTCVDVLGGETLNSSDSSSTVTTTSSNGNITATAPTCAAGSVGWRLYISAAAGASGSEILYNPTAAGCTPAATGVRPSCALTSGSVTSALVTSTAVIPVQASAYAMAIEAMDVLPTPYLRSWPPFVVTGAETFGTAYTIGQFSLQAGYMNQVGKSIQVCGNFNLTPSATGTDIIAILAANAFGQSPNTIASFTSGALTNAAYTAPFCVTITTAVAGASGTFEVHGTVRFGLASTGLPPAAGYTDGNTATVTAGDLTKELSISITSQPGTSNVTQGQLRQLTITPLN